MTDRIGFIGLGDIGCPMAARVLESGYHVTSCANRRREAIEALKARGLLEADDPYTVGEHADILLSVVVDESQTDAVLRGPRGALSGLQPSSTVVVMSTVSPSYCQELAREALAKDIEVLDCPVSGGNARAEQGALALICGGSSGALERCRPVLETMGTIHHCGEVGMGQVAKLVNQGLILSIARLLQETRAMATSYGMDLDTLMQVLSQSTGHTSVGEHWSSLKIMWPHLMPLAKKDLDLCIEAARAKGVSMPLVEARRELSWELNADD